MYRNQTIEKMTTKKSIVFGLSMTLLSLTGLSQNEFISGVNYLDSTDLISTGSFSSNMGTNIDKFESLEDVFTIDLENSFINPSASYLDAPAFSSNLALEPKEPFFKNKRNLYSSLWAFASLNYLYADLVGLMDHHVLNQYSTGTVEGIDITPKFLTVAAAFMQIPLANVFLPHIIKNDKALRWVQIISGSIMTTVQTSTLFIGKPSPYYALFSSFEIAATTFITVDAIKWKPKPHKKAKML